MVSLGMMKGLLLCELDGHQGCSKRSERLRDGVVTVLLTMDRIMRQLNALSMSDDRRFRCELGHHWQDCVTAAQILCTAARSGQARAGVNTTASWGNILLRLCGGATG
jgi:hypothetical protein